MKPQVQFRMPAAAKARGQDTQILWINHLELRPADQNIKATYDENTTGQQFGLIGLLIEPAAAMGTGSIDEFIARGLEVPPSYLITGVRVCYQLSTPASFISQIRLSQLQDPPDKSLVVLDDGTDHVAPGPICVDSAPPFTGSADPSQGAITLALRLHFAGQADRILLRGVGLHLSPIAVP